MENEALISVHEFCVKSSIEESFIYLLVKSELIEVTVIREQTFIHHDQLHRLEKLARLYYDLDINMEGIEVIDHLLRRLENMQGELNTLRNRLRFEE